MNITIDTRQWPLWLLWALGIITLWPILISMTDIWDGQDHYMAIRTGNLESMKTLFYKTRWVAQYYSYIIPAWIDYNLGIPYKIFLNITSVVSVVGICVEVFRIAKSKLGMSPNYAQFAVVILLVYPPFATLMTSILASHIICVWFFLLSVRFAERSLLLAFPFFAVSLTVNSIFAFAVGYMTFSEILKMDATNWKQSLIKLIAFSLPLTIIFYLYKTAFPPLGRFATYNSFDLRTLSFVRYLLVAAASIGLSYYFLARDLNKEEKLTFLRKITACFVLFLFACLAYWYVDKPIKILGTNSFTPRHAFLASVPFSLILAYLFEQANRRFGKKIIVPVFTIIALFLFSYQYAGYQQKFAHLLHQEMFADTLKKFPAPLPGFIVLKTDRESLPKYNRDFESMNRSAFFDAYNENSWVTVRWDPERNGQSLIPEHLRSYFGYLDDQSLEEPRLAPPIDEVNRTLVELTLDNFDPFGSPFYTYKYFTRDYAAFNPQVKMTTLPKMDY